MENKDEVLCLVHLYTTFYKAHFVNACLPPADFGVSEIFEGDRAVIKNSAGSPAFLPPEAVDPDITSFDGQLLDIWACGVTLWIFCFGRVPFRGDSILKLHENIREAK